MVVAVLSVAANLLDHCKWRARCLGALGWQKASGRPIGFHWGRLPSLRIWSSRNADLGPHSRLMPTKASDSREKPSLGTGRHQETAVVCRRAAHDPAIRTPRRWKCAIPWLESQPERADRVRDCPQASQSRILGGTLAGGPACSPDDDAKSTREPILPCVSPEKRYLDVPGNLPYCRRYRYPSLVSSLRTSRSGVVSRARMSDIRLLRSAGLSVSAHTIAIPRNESLPDADTILPTLSRPVQGCHLGRRACCRLTSVRTLSP